MKALKYSTIFGVLSICLACTPKLSLQSYFVDHQETAVRYSKDAIKIGKFMLESEKPFVYERQI